MDYAVHAPHVHVSKHATAVLAAFVLGGGAAVGIVAISGGLSSSSQSQPAPVVIHSSHAGQLDQSIGARP